MTLANPITGLKGSRLTHFIYCHPSLPQAVAKKAFGQGDSGMPIRAPGRFVSMFCSAASAAGTLGQTITISAHKNSVAAGNRIFETVFTQTGAADVFVTDNVTPTNSEAINTFTATDDLILLVTPSATTGAVTDVFVDLCFEYTI